MPIWIHLNVNFCYNLLCQLDDPMSAISFMRECISEPMNPGPLFIIRNTFLFTVPLFLFSVIINFENTKIFHLLHFTNQNTTTISFTVYHCIAYYSLRPILLFTNTDVSATKMCLDTSTLAKSIMDRREYFSLHIPVSTLRHKQFSGAVAFAYLFI
jgi:hypothetical protein